MIRLWIGLLIAVASLIALAAAGDWLIGMHGVSAYGIAIDLGTVVLALVMTLTSLRLFDAQLGWNTAERIYAMDDKSLAVYLAGRLIAIGLLLGLALS